MKVTSDSDSVALKNFLSSQQWTSIGELGRHIRLNALYHERRLGFLTKLLRLEKFVIAITTTTVAVSFKSVLPSWVVTICATTSGLFTILLIVSSAEEALLDHAILRRKFQSLLSKYAAAGVSVDKLQEVLVECTEIEAEQPIPIRSLLNLVHNEILTQDNINYRVRQNWFSRIFAQIIDLDANRNIELIPV
jgi:hypothetical protein